MAEGRGRPQIWPMRVLYLEGDGAAGRYLSGTFRKMGVDHHLTLPGESLPQSLSGFQAVVISNFPRLLIQEAEVALAQAVALAGMGLLMVGGPHAFGRGGYVDGALAALLPVETRQGDDRRRLSGGAMVEVKRPQHPLLRSLRFGEPLSVMGFNRLRRRPGTSELLSARAIAHVDATGVQLAAKSAPLLVVRESVDGVSGRTAALATSLSPPWSGGLTEWGERRLSIDAQTEVGEGYAVFVLNLMRWLCGEEVLFRGEAPSVEAPGELLSDVSPEVRAATPTSEGDLSDPPTPIW